MATKQGPVRRANEDEGGGWTFACPRFPLCDFTSTGWSTKELATERGDQHEGEHVGDGVTQELVEFRNERKV